MPTDGQQFSNLPLPYKLNNKDAAATLQADEASELVNMFREGNHLVKRRGLICNTITLESGTVMPVSAIHYDFLGSVSKSGLSAGGDGTWAVVYYHKDSTNGLPYIKASEGLYRQSATGLSSGSRTLTPTGAFVSYGTSGGGYLVNFTCSATNYSNMPIPVESGNRIGLIGMQMGSSPSITSPIPCLFVDVMGGGGETAKLRTFTGTFTNGSTSVTGVSSISSALSGSTVPGLIQGPDGGVYEVTAYNSGTTTMTLKYAYEGATAAAATNNKWAYGIYASQFDNAAFPTSAGTYRGYTCSAMYKDRWFVGDAFGVIKWSLPGKPGVTNVGVNYISTGLRCITGMIEFDGGLFIFGPDGVMKLTGYDEDSFVLSPRLADIGCVEPSAPLIVAEKLYFPSVDGIFRFNKASNYPEKISNPVDGSWDSKYKVTYTSYASGVYGPAATSIQMAGVNNRFLIVSVVNYDIAKTASTLTYDAYDSLRYLVYDIQYDAWFEMTNVMPTSATPGRVPHMFFEWDSGVYAAHNYGITRFEQAFISPTRTTDGDLSNYASLITYNRVSSDLNLDSMANGSTYPIVGTVRTRMIPLNPDGRARIHEILLEHSSGSNSATALQIGAINLYKDPNTQVNSGTLPLYSFNSSAGSAGTYTPKETVGVITQRISSADSVFDCRYFAIEIASSNSSEASARYQAALILNRVFVRWTPTRQSSFQTESDYS